MNQGQISDSGVNCKHVLHSSAIIDYYHCITFLAMSRLPVIAVNEAAEKGVNVGF